MLSLLCILSSMWVESVVTECHGKVAHFDITFKLLQNGQLNLKTAILLRIIICLLDNGCVFEHNCPPMCRLRALKIPSLHLIAQYRSLN